MSEHPFAGAAEMFFAVDKKDHGLTEAQVAALVPPLQKLIERAYQSGREDAHHEIVCALEGGEIASRPWPHRP